MCCDCDSSDIEKQSGLTPEIAQLLKSRRQALDDQKSWQESRRLEKQAKKQREMDNLRLLEDEILGK